MKTAIAVVLLIAMLPGLAPAADPTRPPTDAEVRAWLGAGGSGRADSDLQLQSVLVSDSRRIAIINGERLRPGDRIAGARIKDIEFGRVVIERGERTITLHLDNRPGSEPRTDKR